MGPSIAAPRRRLVRRPSGLRASVLSLAAALTTLGTATPAWADPSVQVQHLCAEAAVPCSVQTDFHQREGAASGVMVTGRARTAVSLRVFRIAVVDGKGTGITPIGAPIEVRTDDFGFGSANLAFEPLASDQDGGWILVAPDDVTWDDPSQIVGVVAGLSARRPTILGDGYGPQKPVGKPLDLHLTNAIINTRFTVEYLAEDGSWTDARSTGAAAAVEHPDGITSVSYTVPQGLEPRPYYFRLMNLTDPSAEAQQWQVTPSLDPVPQPRSTLPEFPELGQDVEGAEAAAHHPHQAFMAGLSGTAGAGLVALIGWVGLAARRRSSLVRELHG